MTLHDELRHRLSALVETAATPDAEAAAAWLRRSMLDAMQPMINPVLLDVKPEVLATWGG
jgi:hypothetical protein